MQTENNTDTWAHLRFSKNFGSDANFAPARAEALGALIPFSGTLT